MRLKSTFAVYLSLLGLLSSSSVFAELPTKHQIEGLKRVKQLTNYCGPACMETLLRYNGKDISQETIGKVVYEPASRATNGADLLLYARNQGLSSYSWNSSLTDAKRKIAEGVPVLALQQNSLIDTSGHFRILSGYDDTRRVFTVVDPYYSRTEISYSECERLWRSMGYWAMLVVPVEKDTFKDELGERNPVLHMDLAQAKYKCGLYDEALEEAQCALDLQPHNRFAKSILSKIQRAMGAGK